jgi:hypothetical protein
MSGERRTLQNYAYWSSRKTYRSKPGPVPTLGELQRGDGKWCWLWCEKCWRKAPFAFAAAVIQWGADASSDVLRQRARCKVCGNKGATIQHPSWVGEAVGFQPFPVPAGGPTKIVPSAPVVPFGPHNPMLS